MSKFKNAIKNTLKRVPSRSPKGSKDVSPNRFQAKMSFLKPSMPESWKPRSKTVILMEKKIATDPNVV